jgi:hypothetical protein
MNGGATLADTGENAIRLAIERLFPSDTSVAKGRVRGWIVAPVRRRSANEDIMKKWNLRAGDSYRKPNAEEKVGSDYGPKPTEHQAKLDSACKTPLDESKTYAAALVPGTRGRVFESPQVRHLFPDG